MQAVDLYLDGFLGCPALFLQAQLQLLVVPVQLTQLLPGLGRLPLSLFAQSLDKYRSPIMEQRSDRREQST